MLLILKFLGLCRVDCQNRRGKLATIYFVICVFVSLVSAYHGYIWSVSLGDYSFHLRNFLAVLHMAIFFAVPLLNLVQFGLINRFNFSLWNERLVEELLRFNIRVICDDTRYVKACSYLCIALISSITEGILYMYGLTRVYDYIPVIMVELWCLVPVLEYLRVIFVVLALHRVVLRQIVLSKKLKIAYNRHRERCWPIYVREYAVSNELTLKKLKRLHKIILNVCYVVVPREYGFSVFLLVISYALSFLHDVCIILPVMLDFPIVLFSSFRTIFKFLFLIVFFVIGENNSAKVST